MRSSRRQERWISTPMLRRWWYAESVATSRHFDSRHPTAISARALILRAGAMQVLVYELRRITLPRTPVKIRLEEAPGTRRTPVRVLPIGYLPSVAHLWKISPILSRGVTGYASILPLAN